MDSQKRRGKFVEEKSAANSEQALRYGDSERTNTGKYCPHAARAEAESAMQIPLPRETGERH